jgi:hypothetical protein
VSKGKDEAECDQNGRLHGLQTPDLSRDRSDML